MKKITLLLTSFLLIAVLSASLTLATTEEFCEDADLVIDVDLLVVGDGCFIDNITFDSVNVNISKAGEYEIFGLVERGNPTQAQINEAFYLLINSQQGPIAEDDLDPNAITTNLDFLGIFNLEQGDNTIEMHTVAQCPPDTSPNSVELTKLCLYFEEPEETWINIIDPKPMIYSTTEIPVELESNSDTILYSIDSQNPKKPYAGITTETLEEGTHILYGFAEDAFGEYVTDSVTFTIRLPEEKNDKDNDISDNIKRYDLHYCEKEYYNYYYFNEPFDDELCDDYEKYENYFSGETKLKTTNLDLAEDYSYIPEETPLYLEDNELDQKAGISKNILVLVTPLLLSLLLLLFLLGLSRK